MNSIKRLPLIGIAVMLLAMMITPAKSETPVLKDPVLEYSYHLKMDLSGCEATIKRILDTKGLPEKQAEKLMSIQGWLREGGIFDLDEVTFDCKFDKDKIFFKTFLKLEPAIMDRESVKEFIFSTPSGSVVRTMIPEDDTLFWLTVMDPATIVPILKGVFKEQFVEGITGSKDIHPIRNIRKQTGYDLFKNARKYFGRESHLVLYDVDIDPMAEFPEMSGAFIASFIGNMDEDMVAHFSQMIDTIFTEKYGATLTVEKWANSEYKYFTDFGCPAPIKLSYIIDKNYVIFATDPETLTKTAELVMTPTRTAYSVTPPIMNGMITINMNMIMKKLPVEFFDVFMMAYGDDPHEGKLRDMIDSVDWGDITFKRTHSHTGINLECSMNRELYSLLFHVWREGMVMGIKEEIKWSSYRYEEDEGEVETAPPQDAEKAD